MERDRIVDQEGMLYIQFNSANDFELIEKYARVISFCFWFHSFSFIFLRIWMFYFGVVPKNVVLLSLKPVMKKSNVSGKCNGQNQAMKIDPLYLW